MIAPRLRDATIKTPHDGEPPHARATELPLFQRRKRLGNGGLMVMEAAPKRHQRHEDRQDGDQTHTHTSPL